VPEEDIHLYLVIPIEDVTEDMYEWCETSPDMARHVEHEGKDCLVLSYDSHYGHPPMFHGMKKLLIDDILDLFSAREEVKQGG